MTARPRLSAAMVAPALQPPLRSVVVKGTFDVDAALDLARGLLTPPVSSVALDLSRVSSWCIFALVTLVERLRGAGMRVSVVSWPIDDGFCKGHGRAGRHPGIC